MLEFEQLNLRLLSNETLTITAEVNLTVFEVL